VINNLEEHLLHPQLVFLPEGLDLREVFAGFRRIFGWMEDGRRESWRHKPHLA
jgi:hypothetical protein